MKLKQISAVILSAILVFSSLSACSKENLDTPPNTNRLPDTSVAGGSEDSGTDTSAEEDSDVTDSEFGSLFNSDVDTDSDIFSMFGSDTDVDDYDFGFNFTVKIDDIEYKFPMKYSDFMKKGNWTFDNEETTNVSAGSYIMETLDGKDKDSCLDVYFMNFANSVLPVTECYVGGVSIYDSEDFDTVILEGKVDFKTATIDSIRKAFGEPSKYYETKEYTSLDYLKDYTIGYSFMSYDKETVESVDVMGFVKPDDFKEPPLSTEIPKAVKAYTQPESLGDDIKSCNLEIDGVLYQIPAPLDEFLKNGWEIEEDTEIVPAENFETITLVKGNKILAYGSVFNYEEYAVPIKYATVNYINFQTYNMDGIKLKFPGNITLDSTLEDFEKAVKNMDCERTDYDGYVDFDFSIGLFNSITFEYDNDDDDKSLINVRYSIYSVG